MGRETPIKPTSFTALPTDTTTETSTEQAYSLWCSTVRLPAYRGAGAHAPSIFSTTGQSRQVLLSYHNYVHILQPIKMTLELVSYGSDATIKCAIFPVHKLFVFNDHDMLEECTLM